MKITGELHLRRMLAVLLTLVMLMTTFTVPALALGDWQELQLYVNWAGAPAPVQAYPIPASGEQAFWVTVDASALGSGITINASHPNHAFTFDPASDSVVNVPANATSADGMTAIDILAYDNGSLADVYRLYVSTNPIPAVGVPVRYVDRDTQQTLNSAAYPVTPYANGQAIAPDPAMVPAGYELESWDAVSVYVDMNGANPAEVVFYCRAVAQSANVTIRYIDTSTSAVLSEVTNEYPAGQYTIPAETGAYPSYSISPAYVDISVNGEPVLVEFYCTPVAQPANVTVRYIDNSTGAVLSETTNEYPAGQYTIPAEKDYFPTYSITPEYVDISVNGEPVMVEFYCTPVAQPANVTVRYIDTSTNAVLSETTNEYPAGQYTIAAEKDYFPTYSITPEYVDISVNGEAVLVEFYCTPIEQPTEEPTAEPTEEPTAEPTEEPIPDPTEEPTAEPTADPTEEPVAEPTEAPTPVTVDVLVIYQSEQEMREFARESVICIQGEANIITANPALVPGGYLLDGEASYQIEVYDNGTASLNPVVFNFSMPLPADREVSVEYQDENGNVIARSSAYCVEGDNAVAPDVSILSGDYALLDAGAVTVTLNSDGTAYPDPVVFRVREVPVETPIPAGEMIQRWGYTNANRVWLRSDKRATTDTQVRRIENQGTMFYLLREEIAEDGTHWMRVLVDGQQYYIMADYVNVMSSVESEQYMRDHYDTPDTTPVPPMTADDLDRVPETEVPTDEPTEAPTELPTDMPTDMPTADPTELPTDVPTDMPTAEPTEAPTNAPTDMPTASPTPEPYFGYALTTQQVALRTSISREDGSIITTLPQSTLVRVNQPGYDEDGTPWSVVTTLDNISGMLPDSSLRRINDEEAKYYLDQWDAAHATALPTDAPSPSPTPAQVQGYAVAIGDGVPYRNMPSDLSVILGQLMKDEVVYVAGQQYLDGKAWHVAQYGNQWVYVQADLLRMMTLQEEQDYLNQSQKTPEPTLAVAAPTYNPEGMSSYGYVSASSVNFRSGAGTNYSRLATLRQYAFCLVLGTQKIGNTTWYNVNYNGTKGYISGDYFKQMTISELEKFLDSDEYRQGLINNSTGGTVQDNTAGTGTGGLVSAENQLVNEWTNPNNGMNVTYEPFDPFATIGPANTPSSSPAASPSVSPSDGPTVSFEPLATIGPEGTKTESGNGSPWGWVIAIILLLAAAGGVYVYLRIRDSKRKMAQRAAQRRAQAARGDARPYARNNGATPAQQPRTGTYPNQNGGQQPQARRPYSGAPAGQSGQQPNRPANGQSGQGGAARPTTSQTMTRPSFGQPDTTARPSTSQETTFVNHPVAPTQPTAPVTGFERPEGQAVTQTESFASQAPMTGFERPEIQTTPITPPESDVPAQRIVDPAEQVVPLTQMQPEQTTVTASAQPETKVESIETAQPAVTTAEQPAAPTQVQPEQKTESSAETAAQTPVAAPEKPADQAAPESDTTTTGSGTTPRVGRRTAYRQAHYAEDNETPKTDAGHTVEQKNGDGTTEA